MENSNPLANYTVANPAQQATNNVPASPQNQQIETAVPAVNLGTELQQMSHEQINHIFFEINEMVAQIYQEFAKVNSAFGKVSDFFFKSALDLQQGRDPKYLSDDVKDLQTRYELLGLASQALGTAVNAVSSQAKYEMLKPSLREHAQERIDFCKTVAQQLPNMVLNAYNDLQSSLKRTNNISELTTALNTYRKVRYHNLLLDHFIIPQYNDWIYGNFSAEHSIPDMQDVNDELLFPLTTYQGRVRNEVLINSLFNSPDDAVKSIKNALKNNNASNKTLLLIQDSGLLATLQVKFKQKPFFLNELAANEENDDKSQIYKAFINNVAVKDNKYLAKQVNVAADEAKKQISLYTKRDALIVVALAIPAFTYFDKLWAWITVAVLSLFSWYNIRKVSDPINTIKDTKIKRINTYAVTLARKTSGDTPQLLQLSTIQKQNKSILLWALLGALAGFLFIPIPGGLLFGLLLGFLIGGAVGKYEEADRLTDGADWSRIKFESTKWAKIICGIAVIAIALEIYYDFIA
jgi:hypothetical protein